MSCRCSAVLSLISALHADEKAAGKTITLFDGKSTDGWTQAGPGSVKVVDGVLQTDGGMGLFWYNKQEFGDFDLKLQYKVSAANNNSGVFVRFPDPANDPWIAVRQGHEIQIQESNKVGKNTTGDVYDFKSADKANAKPPGEWK